MSKMELLGALEAKKLTHQKCKQYYGTPCITKIIRRQNLTKPRLSSEVMDDSLLSTPWRKGKETNPWSQTVSCT